VLGGELHVMAGHADGALVCLAPLYLRVNARALTKVRELRMMGDAGPRPPALDFLVAPGFEDKAGTQLAKVIAELGKTWDVIELEPMADPSRVRANFVARLGALGFTVKSATAGGGARRIALGLARAATEDGLTSAVSGDAAAIRKGMSALRRLSRLEWAERDEQSPLADAEAAGLLEEVAVTLGRAGRARLATRDDAAGEAVAAALVVDDDDRAVVLALAIDPEHVARGAAERLIAAEALAARARGRVALDVVTGAAEYPLPPLPVSQADRGGGDDLERHHHRVGVAPGRERAPRRPRGARDAQRRRVAGPRRLGPHPRGRHRGRAVPAHAPVPRPDVDPRHRGGGRPVITRSIWPASTRWRRRPAPSCARQLALDEERARATWQRGDRAWIAYLHDRPAGIAWAARGPVEVPELGRTLALSKYEAYVHDVYVAPSARGRAVAPVMLEALARDLREFDVYRSWALIGHGNQPSTRAFAKASFTPVCDVIYARVGGVDRVLCRPPDPEAKELLGLA
jgi:GNAT superfamily N-acetyltransferase